MRAHRLRSHRPHLRSPAAPGRELRHGGPLIARTAHNLVGAAGVAVLEVILLCVAFTLLVPRRVRRWLVTLPTAIAKLSADPAPLREAPRAPRRTSTPRQQIIVVTGAELQGTGLRHLLTAAAAPRTQRTRSGRAVRRYSGYQNITNEERAGTPSVSAPPTPRRPPRTPSCRRLNGCAWTMSEGALKQLGYKATSTPSC